MKTPVTRRHFIKTSTLAAGAGVTLSNLLPSFAAKETAGDSTTLPTPEPAPEVFVQLLDGKPLTIASGVSFGVPWKQGSVPRTSIFRLSVNGKQLPLQSWPLAYWPDGSLKWSGFATIVPAAVSTPMELSVGLPRISGSVKVTNDARAFTVETGPLKCVIPVAGSANLVESMKIDGRPIVGVGQLTCILQNGPQTNPEDSPPREKFVSQVRKVTVEQSGPIRAVVKLEGVHKGVTSGREWLPFLVRLYFYSGQTAVRLVHTITFDGDQENDFVRGLAVQFAVPLREEARNRTVRFVGADGGVWSEPLQPGGGSVAQETGQPFTGRGPFAQNAIWDDFRLAQTNPEGFTIVKRTNPKSTWIFSAAGKRSSGLGFVGDLSGGLAVRVKNFWQSYPAGMEVRRASSPNAELIAWLWSPEGSQMDMRHYDLVAHGLAASYEDVQPGMSTAYGVSRTSELTLYPSTKLPTRAMTVDQAEAGGALPLLAASPAYIHSTGVFGAWSVAERSTAFKQGMEDGLDAVLAFYAKQVDSRHWYGFWHFGDFMHSYSEPRHVWHYDWGGHAWDNTELGTPLWLWYSFLRTGRGEVFRLAEAYTRNTKYDPMRIASPQIPGEPQFAVRLRIGPDWFALAGNWMTEWERTGEAILCLRLELEEYRRAARTIKESSDSRPSLIGTVLRKRPRFEN